MKTIRLAIELPRRLVSPVHEIAMDDDAVAAVHLLYGGVEETDAPTQLYYVEATPDAAKRALEAHPDVRSFDVSPVDDDHCCAYVREAISSEQRALRATFIRDSLVSTLPVEFYADGRLRFRLVGTSEDLEAALEALPDDVAATVERISEYHRPPDRFGRVLTDRQREVLAAARAVGYYDVPRTGSIEDVAAELACAPSTAAEHLRKAESRLVDEVVT